MTAPSYEALEKKLAREIKAREFAEKQLEKYSLVIYEANRTLKNSLARAEKSQRELKFLGDASIAASTEQDIEELLINSIDIVGEFFSAKYGFYFETGSGKTRVVYSQSWGDELDKESEKNLITYLQRETNIGKNQDAMKWLIFPFEDVSLPSLNWVIYTNFIIDKNTTAWLIICTSDEFVDEEHLYVLDTSRGHLQSGIKRRLNELRVERRNKELQSIISQHEKTKKQLIQSEKMASLGQLAAGVAHEINNPIGFVRSNLESLNDYIADFIAYKNELAKAYLDGNVDTAKFNDITLSHDIDFLIEDTKDLVKSNIEGLDRVTEIVLSLKTFSHTGHEKFTSLSIAVVVAQALKIAWNLLKYGCEVENNIEEPLPRIMGNSGQLQQVFINLFVNAAESMEQGGKLTINAKTTHSRLCISVKDTGHGMDEATISKLFTPFFTTKPVGEGTGLGLSVSYAILEAHNASIDVDSQLDVGTTFTITFPIESQEMGK